MMRKIIILFFLAAPLGCGGASFDLNVDARVEDPVLGFIKTGVGDFSCAYDCETVISSNSDPEGDRTLNSTHQLTCNAEGDPVGQNFEVGSTNLDCDKFNNGGRVTVTCSQVGSGATDISVLAGDQGFNVGNCDVVDLQVNLSNQILGLPEETVEDIANSLINNSCPTLISLNALLCATEEAQMTNFCLAVQVALVSLQCLGGV